jgi:hypothetical protein
MTSMKKQTLNFLSKKDGKTVLTLSGTFSSVLKESGGGATYMKDFSGLVIVDNEDVDIEGSDKVLLLGPELEKEFQVDPHQKTNKAPLTTPIKKKVSTVVMNSFVDKKSTPLVEDRYEEDGGGVYKTPLLRKKEEEEEDEIEDVDEDESVAVDYDYSQNINWMSDETMAFLQENSSPLVEAQFTARSPDKMWGHKDSNNNA